MEQKELNIALEYLEKLANEDPEILRKKLYESMSSISFLILEAKKAKFKKGWASALVDRHGGPIFDKEESKVLEELAQQYIVPIFNEGQKGGAPIVPPLKESSASSILQQPTLAMQGLAIDPEQISLDKTFWKIRDFLKSVDAQVKSFSRELGPFRFFYNMKGDVNVPFPVPIPVPPFVSVVLVPVNPRAFPILITFVIEIIRIIYSFGPQSSDTTRKYLSLVLGLVDILKGDWKQGILSLIGYFGHSQLVAGLTTKVVINILELVAPDIQEKMVMGIYQSGKSMVIGFLLWGFANFAPQFARIIARKQFDELKLLVDKANGDIEKVEQSMQSSVAPLGLKLKFNEIPEGFIPTFDDIQNIQAIVRQPAIYCSTEFQEIIEPLHKMPPMRLILELMNIPTDPQTLQYECKDNVGKSLENTIENAVMPQVLPNP
jgi:hypothetical protein